MTHKITRREALVATAATAGAGLLGCVSAGTQAMSPPAAGVGPAAGSRSPSAFLPHVWGQDFMLQWSPPDDLKRDLTVGTQHVRISCASYTISPRGWRGAQRQPWDVQVKAIREAGFTAAESGGW